MDAEDILIPESPQAIQSLVKELIRRNTKQANKAVSLVIAEEETTGGTSEIKSAIEKVIN